MPFAWMSSVGDDLPLSSLSPQSTDSSLPLSLPPWPARGRNGCHTPSQRQREGYLLKKPSSALKPSPDHHIGGLAEHIAGDRPTPQQNARLRRLQRKRRKPLFREKPSALLHPCNRSFHRSRTSRKRNIGMLQI
jgi:hypothetical protein